MKEREYLKTFLLVIKLVLYYDSAGFPHAFEASEETREAMLMLFVKWGYFTGEYIMG